MNMLDYDQYLPVQKEFQMHIDLVCCFTSEVPSKIFFPLSFSLMEGNFDLALVFGLLLPGMIIPFLEAFEVFLDCFSSSLGFSQI